MQCEHNNFPDDHCEYEYPNGSHCACHCVFPTAPPEQNQESVGAVPAMTCNVCGRLSSAVMAMGDGTFAPLARGATCPFTSCWGTIQPLPESGSESDEATVSERTRRIRENQQHTTDEVTAGMVSPAIDDPIWNIGKDPVAVEDEATAELLKLCDEVDRDLGIRQTTGGINQARMVTALRSALNERDSLKEEVKALRLAMLEAERTTVHRSRIDAMEAEVTEAKDNWRKTVEKATVEITRLEGERDSLREQTGQMRALLAITAANYHHSQHSSAEGECTEIVCVAAREAISEGE